MPRTTIFSLPPSLLIPAATLTLLSVVVVGCDEEGSSDIEPETRLAQITVEIEEPLRGPESTELRPMISADPMVDRLLALSLDADNDGGSQDSLQRFSAAAALSDSLDRAKGVIVARAIDIIESEEYGTVTVTMAADSILRGTVPDEWQWTYTKGDLCGQRPPELGMPRMYFLAGGGGTQPRQAGAFPVSYAASDDLVEVAGVAWHLNSVATYVDGKVAR